MPYVNQVAWHGTRRNLWMLANGPRQANLVLIAYASSEGSGEPAHPRSLARTSLVAHTSSESRGTFRQKASSLAPLNGWACAVKICHDGMREDTNLLDGAQIICAVRTNKTCHVSTVGQSMRSWYLSHRRPAKAQASLRIRAVSPEPSLFAHIHGKLLSLPFHCTTMSQASDSMTTPTETFLKMVGAWCLWWDSILTSGNILTWRLVMKYFQRPFPPYLTGERMCTIWHYSRYGLNPITLMLPVN